MGVYVYSLRKKKTKIYIDAEPVLANHYDYAYKVSHNQWWNEDKGYLFRARNTENLAQAAFDVYDGGYVIVGNGADGDAVYKNVTDSVWYDTGDFPGEYVGKLVKFGAWLLLEELVPIT